MDLDFLPKSSAPGFSAPGMDFFILMAQTFSAVLRWNYQVAGSPKDIFIRSGALGKVRECFLSGFVWVGRALKIQVPNFFSPKINKSQPQNTLEWLIACDNYRLLQCSITSREASREILVLNTDSKVSKHQFEKMLTLAPH